MFYARKHSPLLLTWSQSPDALVVNDGPGGAEDLSPPSAPTDAACMAHVHDFPNNTPNATTAIVQNFSGNEQFGRVTFVVPGMCHTGHDSNSNCLGTATDSRGGMQGIDRWLELNLDGLRRDVGQNGVVIVTFDENHTSDGAGVVGADLHRRSSRASARATAPARSPPPAAARCQRRAAPTATTL